MWNIKANVIPVIIGATGTISKSLRQYLSNITGKAIFRNDKKSHIRHSTHIAESANEEEQHTFHWQIKHYM